MPNQLERFSLEGRAALVTGAGHGIGRAIAISFAEAGARVVAVDRDEEAASSTRDTIVAAGGECTVAQADVSRRADVDAAAQACVDAYGRLDSVVNAAGVIKLMSLADLTDETLQELLGIHLHGAFYTTQAGLRLMRANGTRGSIIHFVSGAIDHPSPTLSVYTAAKAGVAALTKVAAMEAGGDGIRVNAIAPGAIRTNMGRRHGYDAEGNFDPVKVDQFYADRAKECPLQTVGEPEEVALMALYLASDAARFVTGQTLRINGGSQMPW
ncbi:SDR family NAD(P)-dependent oxidoreductase [Streptomyces muensis]|uniref:SDR family oxidoreductase n=1 Tax=Streptomyces muensis TaxID=1077944 RepID=A0A9X1TIK4_STRM4|nr:SDR family NAD(P)-dependent oxidoreductase [Streptomyces muensis]MCF1592332.1 SDR family oxidoreductase [Streptomyces muensis]